MPTRCASKKCCKFGDLKCGRCKWEFYCSRTCQSEDWKFHKKQCPYVVTPGTKVSEFSRDGFGINFSASLRAEIRDLPNIPAEYRERYGEDEVGYTKLFTEWDSFQVQMVEEETDGIEMEKIDDYLRDRWKVEPDTALLDFLEEAEFGEIFETDSFSAMKTVMMKWDYAIRMKHHRFRNTQLRPELLNVQIGKTYVNIGFVDIQQMVFSNITNPEDEGRVKWFGYESNPICVAKSKLLLELIHASACSPREILQVWYSSTITIKALNAVQKCCKLLIDLELNAKVEAVFEHWSSATWSVADGRKKWRKSTDTTEYSIGFPLFNILRNMENVIDRQEVVRYFLTGEIFLTDSDELKYSGNITMFACTDTRSNGHARIFNTVNLKELRYVGSLVSTVENHFLTKLANFSSALEKDMISVVLNCGIVSVDKPSSCGVLDPVMDYKFHNTGHGMGGVSLVGKVKDIEKDKNELLDEIKSLKPDVIDWTNIPDYLTPQYFFKLAKLCSVVHTKHTFHLMNWQWRIYGCCVFDYLTVGDLSGCYTDKTGIVKRLYESLKAEFYSKLMKEAGPVLRSVHIKPYTRLLIILGRLMLNLRFMGRYMDYFFKDQRYIEREWKAADYSPFSRVCGVVHASFTNNQCDRDECTKLGKATCTKCSCVTYCSNHCKAKSWEEHKPVCVKLRRLSDARAQYWA